MVLSTTSKLKENIMDLEEQLNDADLRAHEKYVKDFINNGVIWRSYQQKCKGFFTCPYCTKNYNFWSQHQEQFHKNEYFS
jgi:hypothetical protein